MIKLKRLEATEISTLLAAVYLSGFAISSPIFTLDIQSGRTYPAAAAGGSQSAVLYNGTADCGISTQYSDTWNNFNGKRGEERLRWHGLAL